LIERQPQDAYPRLRMLSHLLLVDNLIVDTAIIRISKEEELLPRCGDGEVFFGQRGTASAPEALSY